MSTDLWSKSRSELQHKSSLSNRFSEDNEWYRAKVEKIEKGGNASILYVDYGNREVRCSSVSSFPLSC